MSALGTWPTLLDVSKATDPNGKIAKIAEVLSENNMILDDIPWVEGNLATGHQMSVRTSLPTPTFRLLNQGVVPAKTTNGQIVDGCAIIEGRNHIDKDLAELNGNTEGFRMQEDQGFFEGFNQTLADTLIYGDISTDPEQFNGLDSRYYSTADSGTGSQIINGGGTGTDNTSIWLVGWAPGKVFGIYPKGTKAGMQFEDLGLQEVITSTSTMATMRAYVSWFQWKCGLAVQDYRYVARIANIDISDLETASDSSDSSANLLKLMVQALSKMPSTAGVRPAFYMNERVRAMLAVKLLDKSNVWLKMEEVKRSDIYRPAKELTFMGIPCRRVDAILNTETEISAA